MPDVLRYYLDEHLAELAEPLRKRGIDVLTTQEAGRALQGIDDLDQLAYATSLGRVLVTKEKREFRALDQKQVPHAGIIILQRKESMGKCIEFLERATHILDSKYMQNHLEYYFEW